MASAKKREWKAWILSRQTASSESGPGSGRLTIGDVQFEGNAAIDRWIKYYTESQGGRQTMQIGINRSSSYILTWRARGGVRQLDVPQDLVWLAHVQCLAFEGDIAGGGEAASGNSSPVPPWIMGST